MPARLRATVSMDADLYEYALAESRRRKLSIAEVFRWMLRDGMAHREALNAEYARIAEMRKLNGW